MPSFLALLHGCEVEFAASVGSVRLAAVIRPLVEMGGRVTDGRGLTCLFLTIENRIDGRLSAMASSGLC